MKGRQILCPSRFAMTETIKKTYPFLNVQSLFCCSLGPEAGSRSARAPPVTPLSFFTLRKERFIVLIPIFRREYSNSKMAARKLNQRTIKFCQSSDQNKLTIGQE